MTIEMTSGPDQATPGPRRIQRQRIKGWRMPEGAVYVGRPSSWGNPFTVGSMKMFANDADPNDRVILTTPDIEAAVRNFRWLVSQPGRVELIRGELAGCDLACWCPEGTPCHGDVLLEIANSTGPVERPDVARVSRD